MWREGFLGYLPAARCRQATEPTTDSTQRADVRLISLFRTSQHLRTHARTRHTARQVEHDLHEDESTGLLVFDSPLPRATYQVAQTEGDSPSVSAIMKSVLSFVFCSTALAGPLSKIADSRPQLQHANHIFNAIHSSMRQFGSSLNHNGMSVFIATVPENTEFYHGTNTAYRVNETEWLAFEPEHALMFARGGRGPPGGGRRPPGKAPPGEVPPGGGPPPEHADAMPRMMRDHEEVEYMPPPPGQDEQKDNLLRIQEREHPLDVMVQQKPVLSGDAEEAHGYLHTYRTKHALRLLYVDGQSAAKSEKGTLDVQDMVLLHHDPPATNAMRPPHGPDDERNSHGGACEGRTPRPEQKDDGRQSGEPQDCSDKRKQRPGNSRHDRLNAGHPVDEGRGHRRADHGSFIGRLVAGLMHFFQPQRHGRDRSFERRGPSDFIERQRYHVEQQNHDGAHREHRGDNTDEHDPETSRPFDMPKPHKGAGGPQPHPNPSERPFAEEEKPTRRPHGPLGEAERAEHMCQLAQQEWDDQINGILRMEGGFEIILCDFAKHLDVVRIVQTKSDDSRGGPGGPGGNGRDHFSYYEAVAARYDGIGGGRVTLDYENFVTLFAVEDALYFDDTGRPRVNNETSVIEPVSESIRKMVSSSDNKLSGTDWQAIADLIVARYADRIAYLASGDIKDLESFKDEVDLALRPFVDYGHRNSAAEIERCASQFLPSNSVASASLAGAALLNVTTILCRTLSAASSIDTLPHGLSTIRGLKSWLGWTEWKKCRGCGVHELCFLPIWPAGSVEDFEKPQCMSDISQAGHGYWGGFGRPPK